jgi:hypothetical protein
VAALFRRQVRIGRASAAHRTFSLRAKLLTVPAIGAYAIAVVALFAMGRRTHAIKQLLKIATRLGRIDRWVFPSS